MEKQFLTKEEIEQIKYLSEQYESIKEKAGIIEVQIMGLNISKKELEKELKDMQDIEKTFGATLNSKYGEGSISIETGEFIPN